MKKTTIMQNRAIKDDIYPKIKIVENTLFLTKDLEYFMDKIYKVKSDFGEVRCNIQMENLNMVVRFYTKSDIVIYKNIINVKEYMKYGGK